MGIKIPVCVPRVPKNASYYVNQLIDRNWIGSNCRPADINFITKLEQGFSRFMGTAYGIAVNSGTTALQLAVAALGIGPGDEVIIPDFTMIATAAAVLHAGATPVFTDVNPGDWCMNTGQIESVITSRTKAIIPVHIYGYPVDMDSLLKLAENHGLWVIEDASEAIGAEYKGRHAGSIGHAGCFSFYSNKTVQCGEGGILITNDEKIAEKARLLKNHAFTHTRFIHKQIGYNFKMSNLAAAFAFASFEEIEDSISGKIENAGIYHRELSRINGIQLPPPGSSKCVNSYWMYGILVEENKFGCDKQSLRQVLMDKYGIETRDFFYPMHKQPALKKAVQGIDKKRFPISERLWDQGLYLPSSVDIGNDEIEYVANAIRQECRVH